MIEAVDSKDILLKEENANLKWRKLINYSLIIFGIVVLIITIIVVIYALNKEDQGEQKQESGFLNKIKANFVVNDPGSKTKLINNPFDNLNIHLFINDNEINFEYEYQFNETGEYLVEFHFNEELSNLSSLFMDVINLKKIDLTGIKTDKVKNMDNLFKGCITLESANLNKINTFNVESMK